MVAKVVDKDARRKELIGAAMEVFSEKGFEKATIKDIAIRAGVGKGTVYEYFENKKQIVELSFSFFLEKLGLSELEGTSRDCNLNCSQKIVKVIDRVAAIFLEERHEVVVNLMFNMWTEAMRTREIKGIIYEDMKGMYRQFRNEVIAILEEGVKAGEFRKDINCEGLSTVLVGVLDGLLVQRKLDRDVINFDKAVKSFTDMFLKGLGN